jgi:CheY-like chemotaxis protein
MPGIDGVKVIKELRKQAANFPVIAMSGVMLGQSKRTALDIFPIASGLSDVVCLKKPFRAAELLAAVEKVLAVPV